MLRSPQRDPDDELFLKPGVNLLVGAKDAGKTKWLSMLDYAMGDTDPPEKSFGEDLAVKYDSILIEAQIDSERLQIERRWKEEGARTKVMVNGASIPAHDFSAFLLKRLGIPLVHFPKGNPYMERGWPELSWRMLLRHVYRQEMFWSDFADQQPAVEQHACLAQFLDVASKIFPEKYGELVAKEKELQKLEAEREAFLNALGDITRELLNQQEITVTVTPDSVAASIDRLSQELDQIRNRRQGLLQEFNQQQAVVQQTQFESLKQRLARIEAERDALVRNREKTRKREQELAGYRQSLLAEVDRLGRASASTETLADLKVTHCPVCDQALHPPAGASSHCFLCRQTFRLRHLLSGGGKQADAV